MAITRGGYELGTTQETLTEGVRKYYDRQQADRNLLLGGDSGIVNHHFGIGDFDRSRPLDELTQDEIASELHRLEMNEIDALLAQMGDVQPRQKVLDAGCGRGGTAFSIALRTAFRLSGSCSARIEVFTAIMPQPISTPTAAGITAPRVGITLPMVAPLPRCTSGIAATQR